MSDFPKLADKLNELMQNQMHLVEQHKNEATPNLTLAFLSYWAIFEGFAKSVGVDAKRVSLKNQLETWLDYLNNPLKSEPKSITLTAFDLPRESTRTIPSEPDLQLILPKAGCPQFLRLISSKGKFRKKRNDVAHKGVSITEGFYKEFEALADASIAELKAFLVTKQV